MRYVLNHHITSIITLSMLALRKLIIQQKLNSLPNFEWGCGLFVKKKTALNLGSYNNKYKQYFLAI